MVSSVLVSVLCILGLAAGSSHKLPTNFPRCQKKDPNIDTCLKKAVEKILPDLVKGVPSLGVFPIDPLMITTLSIGNSNGGSVAIDIKFKDLLIKNLKTARINSVKSDIANYKIFFNVDLAEPMILEGKYEANGKVIILPVKGKGNCHLKLDNLKATLAISGKEKKKDGVRFMDVKEVKLDFTTTRLHLNFEDLLGNAASQVGEGINTFLNQNWRPILDDLKPGIEEGLGATFKDIANRVFSKVPYDQIFL